VLLRRMLLIIAVLMALTAVTVALSPGDRGTTDTTGAAPPAATAAPGDAAAPGEVDAPAPGDSPLQTFRADASGQLIRLDAGDRVLLRVVSDELETVQLGTDGEIEVVDADSPAEFDILAEPGLDVAVRLLESGRTIGRVTAQP
jgi:hypothetical protein